MRRLLLPVLAFTALAISVLAGAASAQETRASALAKLDAEFAASDTNKDKVLTLPEVTARMSRMAAGTKRLDAVHAKRLAGLWFANTDTNKDGKVTLAESRAAMTTIFDRYDLNGDGTVDGRERAAATAAVRAGPPAEAKGR